MSDISKGKLIYQLTSASALKDTDLFVISSADNSLTRSITLSQLKLATLNGLYKNEDIDSKFDELKLQIKKISDNMSEYDNDVSEIRNEFNTHLNQIRNDFAFEINSVRSEFNNTINELNEDLDKQFSAINKTITDLNKETNNRFTAVNTSITNLENSLTKKINDTDTKLTNAINGLISYGTAVPTSLATGKVYLQYF